MKYTPALVRAAVAACLAVIVAGCTVPSPQPAASSAQPSGSSASASGTPTRASGAAAAGIDEANPPTPVGVVRVACEQGSGLTSATIGVLAVQRRGQVAVARFVVTGVRDDASTTRPMVGFGSLGGCSGGAFAPRLVDGDNLVSYSPIKVAIGDWLSTNPYQVFPDSVPSYLSAVFPAPKPGVSQVDVVVGAGSVTGVPVS